MHSVAAVDRTAASTEKHEAEVEHQKKERHLRACAAVEEGTTQRSVALGGPVTAAAAMRAFRAKEVHRAHEKALQQKRMQAFRATPQLIDLRGAGVFVEEAARQVLDEQVGPAARKADQVLEVVIPSAALQSSRIKV